MEERCPHEPFEDDWNGDYTAPCQHEVSEEEEMSVNAQDAVLYSSAMELIDLEQDVIAAARRLAHAEGSLGSLVDLLDAVDKLEEYERTHPE